MNVEALKALYVALGGALTDTYEDIADGAPVSEYSLICDVISAIAEVAGGGEQGGDSPVKIELTQQEANLVAVGISGAEIIALVKEGKPVYFVLNADGDYRFYYLAAASDVSVPPDGAYYITIMTGSMNSLETYQAKNDDPDGYAQFIRSA